MPLTSTFMSYNPWENKKRTETRCQSSFRVTDIVCPHSIISNLDSFRVTDIVSPHPTISNLDRFRHNESITFTFSTSLLGPFQYTQSTWDQCGFLLTNNWISTQKLINIWRASDFAYQSYTSSGKSEVNWHCNCCRRVWKHALHKVASLEESL